MSAVAARAVATLRDIDVQLVRARNASEARAAVAWLDEDFARYEEVNRARLVFLATGDHVSWLGSTEHREWMSYRLDEDLDDRVYPRPMLELRQDSYCMRACCSAFARSRLQQQYDGAAAAGDLSLTALTVVAP